MIESGSYGSRRQISDTIGGAFRFKAYRPFDQEDGGGFRKSSSNTERFEDLEIIPLVDNIFPAGESDIKSLFPPNVDESPKYQLKLRIPEYIAYSFTPPGFSYAPGSIGGDGAYYSVLDTQTEDVIIPFGTGSLISCDSSGNYFNFDMALLDGGYQYSFKFAFYDDERNAWDEQPEKFTFRVLAYEH